MSLADFLDDYVLPAFLVLAMLAFFAFFVALLQAAWSSDTGVVVGSEVCSEDIRQLELQP